MTTRTPMQLFKEAVQIAKDHGLFVVDKKIEYQVFRVMPNKNVFLGKYKSPQSLRAAVCRITNFK